MTAIPVRSMTGFASQTVELSSGSVLTITLKSVNHRFLDIGARIASEAEEMETALRQAIRAQVVRGHVDLIVQAQRGTSSSARINLQTAVEYVTTLLQLREQTGTSAEPDLVAVLRLPGVMGGDAPQSTLTAEDKSRILACCNAVLEQLNAMRAAEGQQIVADLRSLLAKISNASAQVKELRGPARDAVMTRLRERLTELIGPTADPARLLQEAALLADRSDIAEECARMAAHVEHFEYILQQGGDCGKKLDFLLQEMHREANTMLSKTSGLTGEALRVTTLGLDMKSAIEKCREQVQNIE